MSGSVSADMSSVPNFVCAVTNNSDAIVQWGCEKEVNEMEPSMSKADCGRNQPATIGCVHGTMSIFANNYSLWWVLCGSSRSIHLPDHLGKYNAKLGEIPKLFAVQVKVEIWKNGHLILTWPPMFATNTDSVYYRPTYVDYHHGTGVEVKYRSWPHVCAPNRYYELVRRYNRNRDRYTHNEGSFLA